MISLADIDNLISKLQSEIASLKQQAAAVVGTPIGVSMAATPAKYYQDQWLPLQNELFDAQSYRGIFSNWIRNGAVGNPPAAPASVAGDLNVPIATSNSSTMVITNPLSAVQYALQLQEQANKLQSGGSGQQVSGSAGTSQASSNGQPAPAQVEVGGMSVSPLMIGLAVLAGFFLLKEA